MINVLGSVLKGATPNKWKREQLANKNQYNFSWEKAEAELGMPFDQPEGYLITNGYLDNPQTKADYDLRAAELKQKGGKNGKRNATPATKVGKLTKTVEFVGAAVLGSQLGFAVGKGFSETVGFDVDGGLCSPSFDDLGLVAMITGTDCTDFFALDPAFIQNTDAPVTYAYGVYCSDDGTQCATLMGLTPATGSTVVYPCFKLTKGTIVPDLWSKKAAVTDTSFTSAGLSMSYNSTCVSAGFAGTQISGLHSKGVPVAQWYVRFPGKTASAANAQTTVTTAGDPDRTLKCSVLGSNGQTYEASTAAFKESGGELPAPNCPVLPEGVTAQNFKVSESPAKVGDPFLDLYTENTTPEYRDWMTAFPQCQTGACRLDLLKIGTGTPVSCFDVEGSCTDWFADPNKTANYQCTYGPNPVSLAECNVYSGVFKPERLAIGAAYSDPETGEWSGAQASPSVATGLMGKPVMNPALGRNCWTGGWAGFNPVEWVMQPIQCAIEWAAVPRPAVVQAQAIKLDTDWKTTQVGKFSTAVTSYNFVAPANGCQGIPVDVFFLGPPFYVMNACPGDMLAGMAGWARVFGNLAISIIGVMALSRMFAGIVQYRGLGR